MAWSESIEDKNCQTLYSLSGSIPRLEPTFRSDLMESVVPGNKRTDKKSITADFDQNNQQKENYSHCEADRGKDKRISSVDQSFKAEKAIDSTETDRTEDEQDSAENEEEQYKYLHEASVSEPECGPESTEDGSECLYMESIEDEKLRVKLNETLSQYEILEKENVKLEKELKLFQDNLAREAIKCKMYMEEFDRKQREIENQKDKFKREKVKLIEEKEELMQETVRQSHQLRDLEQCLFVEKQEREKGLEQQKELEQSLLMEKEEKTKIHSQVQVLREENLNLQQEKEKVEKEAQDLCIKFQQEAELTLRTYDQLKEKHDNDIEGMLEQMKSMRAENSELQTLKQKKANEVQTLLAENMELKQNIKVAEDGMHAMKISAQDNELAFHMEREARTKDKANYEAKIQELNIKFKAKSDKHSKELLDQRQQFSVYEVTMDNMRAEIGALLIDKEKTENTNGVLAAENTKLKKAIAHVEDCMLAVKLAAHENESSFHMEREARTKERANYVAEIHELKSKNEALSRDKLHLRELLAGCSCYNHSVS